METVARDDFFESLLGDFLDESGQLLDRLNENLLQLDEWVRALDPDHQQRCSDELMNEMFRSAHSLKGLSAMLGLKEINGLTHRVENVFDAARKDELIVTGDVVELMFQAVDRLGGLVETLKEPTNEPIECESVLQGINRLLESAGVARGPSTQADAERALAAATAELAQAAATSPPPATAEPSAQACSSAETPASEPMAETPAPVAAAAVPTENPPVEAAPQRGVPWEDSPTECDSFAEIADEAEISDKYLAIFIDETEVSLDELSETLVAMEGGARRESLEKLLLISHRIKGSAASVGLNRAAKLAHLMEDLLQNLVEHGGTLSPEMTDAMLRCTDGLRQYVQGLRSGCPRSNSFGQLASELLAAQGRQVGRPAIGAPPTAPPQAEAVAVRAPAISAAFRAQVAAAAVDRPNMYLGEVVFRPALVLVGLKARLIYEKLTNLGEVCVFQPPVDRLDELEELEHVCFGVSSDRSLEWITRQLQIGGVQQVVVEPVSAASAALPTLAALRQPTEAAPAVAAARPERIEPATTLAKPAPRAVAKKAPETAAADASEKRGGAAPAEARATETLRVDIDRLDQLMNLAGQLVINKARFAQICEGLKVTLSHKHSAQVLSNVFGALDKMASAGEGHDPQSPPGGTGRDAHPGAAAPERPGSGAPRRGTAGPGAQLGQRPGRSDPSARSGDRRHPAERDGHADGADRPPVHPLQARGPRYHPRQRQEHPPGNQGRKDRAGQADDRRVERSVDPHGSQLRPTTAWNRRRCGPPAASRRKGRSRSMPSIAATAS